MPEGPRIVRLPRQTATRLVATMACLAAIWGGIASPASPAVADDTSEPLECIEVRGEAWMQAYGYRHVVIVENGCERPVQCEVWTTADPMPRHRLNVPAGQSRSVVTRIGSPSREVIAQSECELR